MSLAIVSVTVNGPAHFERTASVDRKLFAGAAPLGSFLAAKNVPSELTREDVFFSPLFPSKERLAEARGRELEDSADEFEEPFDRMLRAEFFRTLESYTLLAWMRAANLWVLFLTFGVFGLAMTVDARSERRIRFEAGVPAKPLRFRLSLLGLTGGFTALAFMLIWPAPLAGWALGAVGILMGISLYGAAFNYRRTRG
jgi:hypothetical protein